MAYGIAFVDRHGEEHHRPNYGTFTSLRKAQALAKKLNKGSTNGPYVVVEL